MSIVHDAAKSVEDRAMAVSGSDGSELFVAIEDDVEAVCRKLLLGYVDPEALDDLLDAAKSSSMGTIEAMVLAGPTGAVQTLMTSTAQNFLLGLIIGKSLAQD